MKKSELSGKTRIPSPFGTAIHKTEWTCAAKFTFYRIDQAFLDEATREIGKDGKLTLVDERRPIAGGLILRRGRTETNCALATIIRDARERLETDVAAILFGEKKA